MEKNCPVCHSLAVSDLFFQGREELVFVCGTKLIKYGPDDSALEQACAPIEELIPAEPKKTWLPYKED